jgi:predicted metal-binding membrane protein
LTRYIRSLATLVTPDPNTMPRVARLCAAKWRRPSNATAYLTNAFVMWFLMMIGMMLPSAAPIILLYGARAQGAVLAPTSIFAGMYLAVWGGFSALAALAQWLLVRSGAVSEIGLAISGSAALS